MSESFNQVSLDMKTVLLKVRRIQRLSERPPNPGFAYRHLEHIHALCESLLKDLAPAIPDDAVEATPDAEPAPFF